MISVLEKLENMYPNCSVDVIEKYNKQIDDSTAYLVFNGRHIPLIFTFKSFEKIDANSRTGRLMIETIRHQINKHNNKAIDNLGREIKFDD